MARTVPIASLMVALVLSWGWAASGPVLVELFTSQGCSSCPPADELLRELGREGMGDVPVIPLSLHVDYWNRLGWRDPFSSSDYSKRQRRYARSLDSTRVYTPQLVIGGREVCVGSDRSCIERAVRRAADRPVRARVDLSVGASSENTLVALVDLELDAVLKERSVRLLVALCESGLSTPVPRGENAQRTLDNDFVVRVLRDLPAEAARVTFRIDGSWRRDRMELVAFLQDAESMTVYGAAEVALAP